MTFSEEASVKDESLVSPVPPIEQPSAPLPVMNFEGEIAPETEEALIAEWQEIMGPSYEVVVAQMSKFKANGGLGISLEGTVEKVDGAEQNPHHYIRFRDS